MVGQWTATKPSRSDEVLDADQQHQITSQVRAQFDSMVPKRPTKPNRSEPDSAPTTVSNLPSDVDRTIPELHKLRSLQSQSHVKISEGGITVEQDEFVETEYYREMNSVGKEHHTTGSGFIRVMKEGAEANEYDIQLGNGIGRGGGTSANKPLFKSNPATNDWIPTLEQDQVFVSSKPNRSEGC
ncbi:maternal effect embryo arrest 59 [Hibiscus trionum]|uniref:Maternal effect embryo arrest 59 n=1 Tax=Hibiscus trionum TaxID=183268 RepID=A0A9W7H3M2_HIBTR|nr:maternal effect embryo arrest 59 [Hibiscus trionum]